MRFSILFLISLFALSSNAQLVQVVNEVYYDPEIGPPVEGYPANHRTYRIYANLQDPTDFVSAIYAVAGCHSLHVNAMNQIWNSLFGGTTGDVINDGFCAFVPALCYDSFVTIGRENSSSPGNSIGISASCPAANAWDSALGIGLDLNVCDGAVYALNGDINGFGVGPQNRVLLFQLTVPNSSNFTYKLNLAVFDEGIVENVINYVWDAENVGCGSPTEVDGSGLGLIGGYVLVNSIDQTQLQALALYPNPMADYAIIQFATESNTRFVRLLDLQGKEITRPELASSSVYYLKRNGLPAGAYLVEINDGNNFQCINLILE